MTKVRSQPCSACPYRKDVPSGLWAAYEYDKLRAYDNETFAQPTAGFACHATPDFFCHGWAVCHSNRGHENELLALRIKGVTDVPPSGVELFSSGNLAADHGQKDVQDPSPQAKLAAAALLRKHKRLSR